MVAYRIDYRNSAAHRKKNRFMKLKILILIFLFAFAFSSSLSLREEIWQLLRILDSSLPQAESIAKVFNNMFEGIISSNEIY